VHFPGFDDIKQSDFARACWPLAAYLQSLARAARASTTIEMARSFRKSWKNSGFWPKITFAACERTRLTPYFKALLARQASTNLCRRLKQATG
jgi:hypothetical protein